MNNQLNILMVAAENDGIARCKVGGIGDVIRDIPVALADQGCHTTVVTPSYGYLHKENGADRAGTVRFSFAGRLEEAGVYHVPARNTAAARSVHCVIDHPLFKNYNAAKESHDIYSNDPAGRPFATDATKFACFCAAVASAIKQGLFGQIDVLHLHDWHAALLLLLRKYDPEFASLKPIRTVYTIHNLALQGIRPLSGDSSSLSKWYPELDFNHHAPGDLRDPRWTDCINPMAIGIRLAEAVHAVSPSYAREILEPSRPPQFSGGEGLENDLQHAMSQGRLHGILNGCEYPETRSAREPVTELLKLIRTETVRWAARRNALSFADYIALNTLESLLKARTAPAFTATSVSRVVDQKMLLLKAAGSDGRSGLEKILKAIGPKGLYILLGTGDRDYETFLCEIAAAHPNFLFLNSYSNAVAKALYSCGDLFLMPSSFEPCGIGQMLAMRDGQPCLVNRTGGLRDTVQPDLNGFGFEGDSLDEQVDRMAAALNAALKLRTEKPEQWKQIGESAAQARFFWSESARLYIEKLYTR